MSDEPQRDSNPPARPQLPTPFDAPTLEEKTGEAANGAERPRFHPQQPEPKRTRFSIKFLMLLTLVVAIATAGYNGMNVGGGRRIGALFFTLLAPMLLVVILSLAQSFFDRRR